VGGAATSDGPQPAISDTAINIAIAHGDWPFRIEETGIHPQRLVDIPDQIAARQSI